MVLDRLQDGLEFILGRITESHLSRYDYLQRSLLTTNVVEDSSYRVTFNGYYRMQRRRQDWYDFFFSRSSSEKRNGTVTFSDVLEEIYRSTGRVEAAFGSKLIATIRPEMPVYDKFVRENLSLCVPKQHESAPVRVQKYIGVYGGLQAQMNELVQSDAFQHLRVRFDRKFPAFVHFTDVKKLDLLLWQSR